MKYFYYIRCTILGILVGYFLGIILSTLIISVGSYDGSVNSSIALLLTCISAFLGLITGAIYALKRKG